MLIEDGMEALAWAMDQVETLENMSEVNSIGCGGIVADLEERNVSP